LKSEHPIHISFLPVVEFPTGQVYFHILTNSERKKSVAVHFNWAPGNEKKYQKMVEHGLWLAGSGIKNSTVDGHG
jgi:hypothetical protein